jgi:hypothetical protein
MVLLDPISGIWWVTVGDGRQWLVANLANERSRPARIRTTIELIRTAALPYFESFRDPKQVPASLIDASVPGLSHERALEYVCCYGGTEAAKAMLEKSLKDAPDWFHEGY